MPANTPLHLRTDALYRGCVLASVAHAVAVAGEPDIAYEHSWDGANHSTVDVDGRRGTVTFSPNGRVVGAFRDDGDPRAAGPGWVRAALAALPGEFRRLAEAEALQYLLDEADGGAAPVASCLVWGDGELWATSDGEREAEGGLSLVGWQLGAEEEALAHWAGEWELGADKVAAVRRLFSTRLRTPRGSKAQLDPQELSVVLEGASEDGAHEALASLGELGFVAGR